MTKGTERHLWYQGHHFVVSWKKVGKRKPAKMIRRLTGEPFTVVTERKLSFAMNDLVI